LNHLSELLEKEDLVSVNPNVIKKTEQFHTGLFFIFFAYYVNYIDHRGKKNNYVRYLYDMKKARDMPILVAEFGGPASRG
jgi:hypothetical protein